MPGSASTCVHLNILLAYAPGADALGYLLTRTLEEAMAQRLTKLRVDEVSVVDRAANGKRFLVLKAAATKTEDGYVYTAQDYAYVPDPDKPSTWKLRLTEYIDGKKQLTAAQVGRAVAALSPGGFRGNRVEIPEEDLPAVKRRIREAWRKANPDKDPEDMPEVIRKDDEAKPSLVGRALRSLWKTAGGPGPTAEVEKMTAEEIRKAIEEGAAAALAPIEERLAKLEDALAKRAGAGEETDVAKAESEETSSAPTSPGSEDIAKMIAEGVAAAIKPLEDRIVKLEEAEGSRQSALDEGAHKVRKKAGFWEGSGLLL